MTNADPSPPHHRTRWFRNNYPHHRPPLAEMLRWLLSFGLQRYRKVEFPLTRPTLQAGADGNAVTWIGHSTFLLQCEGRALITDPHLSARASPFTFAGPLRLTPPAVDYADLPSLDIALISHNHYDHLDDATVRRLAREHPQLQFVVPLGLKPWFLRRGITRVTELDWWQHTELAGLNIHAVPVQHFSGRSTRDRNLTLWCGFVVETASRKLFFAGDSGYSQDFADIGKRFAPFDLALLPIGAYDPRALMRAMHVNPEEAVKIHRDIGSRQSVAMHWGTFRLTEEPLDEPPLRLRSALAEAGVAVEHFWVLQHGETRSF